MTDESPTDDRKPVDRDQNDDNTRPPVPSPVSEARPHDLTFAPVPDSTAPVDQSLIQPQPATSDTADSDTSDISDISDSDTADTDGGSARRDPLEVRPRISSIVLCAVFAVLMLLAAAGVWWLGVRTAPGQSYDDMVFNNFDALLPVSVLAVMRTFMRSTVIIATSMAVGAVAVVVMLVRRRWWLLGQSLVLVILSFAADMLKYYLPRHALVNTVSNPANSAPSGHTLLAAAAGMLLVLAVPRVWRAAATVLASCYGAWVGLSVIVGRWHRPTDVVMALLIVAGLALLALAFTRASGMDATGTRFSSASVQIVASVMLTAGVLGTMYAAYIIWQIEPGLELGAQWAITGAVASAGVLVIAVVALTFGLVLAMRQLTASPLTRLGLVGAPPAPPTL